MTVLEHVRDVLASEAQSIASVNVTADYEKAVLALMVAGKVVTTGMGKAGLIARKAAATLSSTGTPAVFLHPGEASHGDVGLVNDGDVLLAFSTSGKTREVIEAIDAARNMGAASVIGITSHADSPLRFKCDVLIDMGIIDEPCPLGLTPTASSAVMLAISDALAIAVMSLKGITREDFGRRHRGGYLGKVAVQ